MSKIKLSSEQIFILEQMQKGKSLSYSGIYKTFRMNLKSLNRLTVSKLESLKLIEKGEDTDMGSYSMKLTDMAKSLEL
jgi:hypothetical protein